MSLGRKQAISDPATWQAAIDAARAAVPANELDALVDRTVASIQAEMKAGRRVAYGWSGGKDSQVLRWVMELAGAPECVLAMTSGALLGCMYGAITPSPSRDVPR